VTLRVIATVESIAELTDDTYYCFTNINKVEKTGHSLNRWQ